MKRKRIFASLALSAALMGSLFVGLDSASASRGKTFYEWKSPAYTSKADKRAGIQYYHYRRACHYIYNNVGNDHKTCSSWKYSKRGFFTVSG